MGLWSKIQAVIGETRRRTLGAALDALAEQRVKRDEAAFSIALIALSAKMAKADGVVTDDEIEAFTDFFQFDEEDADKVRMVYNLAQQDVAGFEHYLSRVARISKTSPSSSKTFSTACSISQRRMASPTPASWKCWSRPQRR